MRSVTPSHALATGLWAELCHCSPAPGARQGLNRRPHLAPLAPGLWAELCRCSPAPGPRQGLNRRPHFTEALSPGLPLPWGQYMGSAHAVFAPPGFGTPRESIPRSLACASVVQLLDQPFRSATLRPGLLPVLAVAVQVGHHAHELPS